MHPEKLSDYEEEDFLMLSGLQHFIYCRRQWALIHIEQQWVENYFTVDGNIFHEKAHNAEKREKREGILISRGMKIFSRKLGLSGNCDVVEFHKDEHGVTLFGEEGKFHPIPIEYKRGKPKEHQADELQLCAQAMCLEEMLLCEIPAGCLFYGETRRRQAVDFTGELRGKVFDMTKEMHSFYMRGHTPMVKKHKGCQSCSLKDICLPKLEKAPSVNVYLNRFLKSGENE